jgi:hypothetical protein
VVLVMWCKAVVSVALLGAAACGADADAPEQVTNPAMPAVDGATQDEGFMIETDGPEEARFFLHRIEDEGGALIEGIPAIINGCLALRDSGHVVIWHESRRSEALATVKALMADESVPSLSLSGGEGPAAGELTRDIRERCSSNSTWFANRREQ